jgi:hypothetical protein
VRFVVVTLALLFDAGMIYLTVADFAKNGVTGLGVVGVVVVGIVTIGTLGAFFQPARRTSDSGRGTRIERAGEEDRDSGD